MEASSRPPTGRTLTPAVLLATAFMVGCVVLSVAFIAANGGLEVPQLVAAASISPTQDVSSFEPSPSPLPTIGPAPSVGPTPGAGSPGPSPAPSIGPTPVPSIDPLTALPACPDHPGCYEYTIRRGDTLSTIGDHWLISVSILQALNPQVTDPSTIVVGQVLYLGRTPFVRLERCPDLAGCYLYVVRPGDRLSTIAGRFGTSTTAILAINPKITDANAIFSGETIRLPGRA